MIHGIQICTQDKENMKKKKKTYTHNNPAVKYTQKKVANMT